MVRIHLCGDRATTSLMRKGEARGEEGTRAQCPVVRGEVGVAEKMS